jgi:hypothetical protein
MVSFHLMMHNMKVQSYLMDSKAKERLDSEIAVIGKPEAIDYFLLQTCLNIYGYEEASEFDPNSIIKAMLSKFNFDADKLVACLDIENDGWVTREEFLHYTKRNFSKATDVSSYHTRPTWSPHSA